MEEKIKNAVVKTLELMGESNEEFKNFDLLNNIMFEKPKNREHGDKSCNIAMKTAKIFKKSPLVIAEEIIEKLELPDGVKEVKIAGPGFINFYIDDSVLADGIKNILKKDRDFGRLNIGNKRKINLEFSSVNPTGPISVGHGRQAVLGDAIGSIMEFCGYDVTREYYCNDTGNQIKKLGESILSAAKNEEIAEDGYHGDYVKDLATDWLKEIDSIPEDNEVAAFAAGFFARDKLRDAIIEDCKALKVVHDVVYSEESLHESGAVQDTLDFLMKNDIAYEKDNAKWLRATNFGDEKDRVLVKSDGNTTYALNDAAYHKTKIDRGFDEIIDIFGADHNVYIPRLTALVKSLGFKEENFKILIHQFVTVLREGKIVRMSKRAATFITLKELLEEVGPDVIRYYFLERKMDAQVEFDIEAAKKQSMDNPVYYLQYCHARCCSILKEADSKNIETDINVILEEKFSSCVQKLDHEKEIIIIKKCLELPEIIEKSCVNYSPHILIHYAHELARSFQSYYTAGKGDERFRVVVDDVEDTTSRLILTHIVRITIRNILEVLGLNAPDRM